MRGATPGDFRETKFPGISIHAPHAGRDVAGIGRRDRHGISIHAPHAGRDGKTAQFSCAVLRKSNSKYNAADNS